MLLRKPVGQLTPALAAVARLPNSSSPFRHAAGVARVERDHVERVAVVWMRGGREAELARQAIRDLGPRMPAVIAAVHAHVILLVHPVWVGRRADEAVHAESDSSCGLGQSARSPLLRGKSSSCRRVGPKTPTPARSPRSANHGGRAYRRDAEVAGWLVGGSFHAHFRPGLGKRGEQGERLAAVPARRCPLPRHARARVMRRRHHTPGVAPPYASPLARAPKFRRDAAARRPKTVPIAGRSGGAPESGSHGGYTGQLAERPAQPSRGGLRRSSMKSPSGSDQ